MIRVVLDTNVLVSALLCEKGRLALIRHCWQNDRITPVMAEPTVNDQIFLDLAIGAGVQALVSGDRDLLDLADIISVPKILEPEVFRHWLEQLKAARIHRCPDQLHHTRNPDALHRTR